VNSIVYCWHPARGFYYYCGNHKPEKPTQEITILSVSDILTSCQCMECGKQLKSEPRASADPGLSDEDLSELGISPEQARRYARIIVERDTIAREDDAWLEAERRS